MFSILIPSWNNLKYLKCCVESILKNSSYAHQILVFVNEGTDGTIPYLEKENVRYIHSPSNVGICVAFNCLAALAEHDLICYMNDDMYALPDWDKALVEAIEKLNTNKFYLSATMIEPRKGAFDCMIAPHDFGDLGSGFEEEKLLTTYTDFPFHDWNGASWPPALVHKSLWLEVGGYSEEFSPGLYSDPDFSMKLWMAGVRMFKGVSASRVYHFQSKTLHRAKLNDGRKTFKKKWGVAASYFYKEYLKIGSQFEGELPETKKGIRYWIERIRCIFSH